MQRYFIDENEWDGQEIVIIGDNYHHMFRVMRMEVNDQVICNDSLGRVAICEIKQINKEKAVLDVVEIVDESNELPIQVTIAQGLPKRDKLEYVLQKGTELGASRFIPFKAKRSIVKWDDKKSKSRMKRFEKIVKEASEQCHRSKLPIVEAPQTMKQLLNESEQYDVKLVAYEEEVKSERTYSIRKAFESLNSGDKLFVCIGPEGGFSDDEIELLKENGFETVRLGPRILRTETAALYVLASLSYCFEE